MATRHNELIQVSLRQLAVYIPGPKRNATDRANDIALALVARLKKLGFGLSPALMGVISDSPRRASLELLQCLESVLGLGKGWTPLIKGWDTPTGVTNLDHFMTYLCNEFGLQDGPLLSCGHRIPKNTFPLHRYNGCPFCGQPFDSSDIKYFEGQGSKLKVLEYWGDAELNAHFQALLESPVALDASQAESLKVLLRHLDLPEKAQIVMKETLMLVLDTLVANGKSREAGKLFNSPTDILRYLWFKHTGYLQLVQPKVIRNRIERNSRYQFINPQNEQEKIKTISELKLKYSRSDCRRVTEWLNGLKVPAKAACENMHPQREMWVRFIRALRLVEYSKKKGFENLQKLLHCFHTQDYPVFLGEIEEARIRYDEDKVFRLLKQKPGIFARTLFSNMLWFAPKPTLTHFSEIADQLPVRLLLTLQMYASNYFDRGIPRIVQPLGGVKKSIEPHSLLHLYSDEELQAVRHQIRNMTLNTLWNRFEAEDYREGKTFIDKRLFEMPLPIGDRSESIQDLDHVPQGTRLETQGDTIRLFMEWGEGLPSQHLDMDLSCAIAYDDHVDHCSYSQLSTTGCIHSGDIQQIPHMSGTAEYIDVDLNVLRKARARFVSFTCNAYTPGSLNPNMVVGWMDSKYPMRISKKSGVAYDPSCVQHQIRIKESLNKGLVFGTLDVENGEIIWLEMPFDGQRIQDLDTRTLKAYIKKLTEKISIGELLELKIQAQGGQRVYMPDEADACYDANWLQKPESLNTLFPA
ncbi:hypothetical protein FUAX_18240 [Fulvitalea axinellae]|uniref:Uncharacterized protein n=1 Tax=Fulvitalea axinellae TaxID=1182444 RepID=A0AAU9CQZ0_9BACT|nr:hypothetical protein FUAX_18240 [Fulvitalea axinellae]